MAANKIPEPEYRERITKLMADLKPKAMGDQHELKELFRLHNDRMDPHESEGGIFCGGCVTRVYKKMKEYYNSMK